MSHIWQKTEQRKYFEPHDGQYPAVSYFLRLNLHDTISIKLFAFFQTTIHYFL